VLVALAAVPFLVADLRLAGRAEVASAGGQALASPGDAWGELIAALSAFAGGDGIPFVAFTALALLGVVVLARTEPAVAALAASVVVPPLLFLVLRAGSAPDLSPRHLFYALPLWAAAIGVGTSWLARRLPGGLAAALIGATALGAVASPASGLRDPRELGLLPIRIDSSVRAGPHDLLVPYSTPFLAQLGRVREGVALPQGPGGLILDALEHAEEPISTVVVAIPGDRWTVKRLEGPFEKTAALLAASRAIATARHPPELEWWFDLVERGLCEALAKSGPKCPS
jgi:hypothetical protein